MVEKWKSRPKKVRGIPTFPPSRRRLRLDYFLTPQTTLQFSTPLLTQTLQSRQGDTMWVGSTTSSYVFDPARLAPVEYRLGSYPNISLGQSRTTKVIKPHGKSFFGAETRPSDSETNCPQPG